MASRFAACVFLASWVLALPDLRAQPGPGPDYGPPPGVYQPGGPPPGYGPPAHSLACGCPTCAASGLAAPGGAWGSGPQGGFGPHGGFGAGAGGAMTYHQPAYGFDDKLEISPFERWFSKVARNMWIRLEYLNWDIPEPGQELIGEESTTGDPRIPFNIFEPDPLDPTLQVVTGQARALDLDVISYLDADGVRGTIGVPYREFDYEWSWWLLEQNAQTLVGEIPAGSPLLGTAQLIAIPILVDGERTNLFRTFDESFQTRTHVETWGTDMKWIFKVSPQWPGLRVDPLIEARFLQFHENMRIDGVFSGRSTLAGDVGNAFGTTIDSDSMNHIYGAGVGLSARLVHPWVTLGLEPRASLALNTYRQRVTSAGVLAPGDRQVTVDEDTNFCPTAEVKAYFKLNPTPNCTITGGYNLLILSRVARPYDSVRYNFITDPATGALASSDVAVDTEFTTIVVHGWSIGAEFTFR